MIFFLLTLMFDPGLEPAGGAVMTRQGQVKRYFWPRPRPAIKYRACACGWVGSILVIIGLLLLALGHMVSGTGVLIAGLATVGIDLTLASTYQQEYRKSWPKPSEAEMNVYLRADCSTAAAKAMERMDLTPQQVFMTMAATFTREPSVNPPVMLWPPRSISFP